MAQSFGWGPKTRNFEFPPPPRNHHGGRQILWDSFGQLNCRRDCRKKCFLIHFKKSENCSTNATCRAQIYIHTLYKYSFENTLKTCSRDQERCSLRGPGCGSHHHSYLISSMFLYRLANKAYFQYLHQTVQEAFLLFGHYINKAHRGLHHRRYKLQTPDILSENARKT